MNFMNLNNNHHFIPTKGSKCKQFRIFLQDSLSVIVIQSFCYILIGATWCANIHTCNFQMMLWKLPWWTPTFPFLAVFHCLLYFSSFDTLSTIWHVETEKEGIRKYPVSKLRLNYGHCPLLLSRQMHEVFSGPGSYRGCDIRPRFSFTSLLLFTFFSW